MADVDANVCASSECDFTYRRSAVVINICFVFPCVVIVYHWIFFFSLRCDSLLRVIVFKNRMIVSWTIQGNDAFPRFPQGRIISAEFEPQNNPNHTESRITLHTTSTPGLCSVAAASSNLY